MKQRRGSLLRLFAWQTPRSNTSQHEWSILSADCPASWTISLTVPETLPPLLPFPGTHFSPYRPLLSSLYSRLLSSFTTLTLLLPLRCPALQPSDDAVYSLLPPPSTRHGAHTQLLRRRQWQRNLNWWARNLCPMRGTDLIFTYIRVNTVGFISICSKQRWRHGNIFTPDITNVDGNLMARMGCCNGSLFVNFDHLYFLHRWHHVCISLDLATKRVVVVHSGKVLVPFICFFFS